MKDNDPITAWHPVTPASVADCIAAFRDKRSHVHCITNSVAQHFTANVLLAAGAVPSMTIAASEVSDFVSMADALLVNLGTMDEERSKAIRLALDKAQQQGKPWVLDPVFVQASPKRLELARSCLEARPTLVRCNAGEAEALFDMKVDHRNLAETARAHATILALTGAKDAVSDGHRVFVCSNGHALMDRITAMGCALNALMAGFMAASDEQLLGAVSAISLFGLAGQKAGKDAEGPGSFVPRFLDALYSIDRAEIESGLELVEQDL